MDLDKVSGIVITEDGISHYFGKSDENIGASNVLSHEEYFFKEIASQDWFKKLGINYDAKNLYYQISDMTRYGLSFILNASSVSHNERDVYAYCVFVSDNMSDKAKEYFSTNYEEFKSLIEKNKAFFQADCFHNGEYVDRTPIDNLDEFYTKMNIPMKSYKR